MSVIHSAGLVRDVIHWSCAGGIFFFLRINDFAASEILCLPQESCARLHNAQQCLSMPSWAASRQPTSSSPAVVLAVPAEHLPVLTLVSVCLNNWNHTTGTGTNWRTRAGTAAWHRSCGKQLGSVDPLQSGAGVGIRLGSCQQSYQAPNPPRGSCCTAMSLSPGSLQPSGAGDIGTV